ncbi:P-loop NTPase fold protein [Candidatus Absconditicoccus praedator]|uniref:P-loop NTPase fold protein n=1 Tax=Candidatus Absconditicoccus praedator TaxID=2735562 RepID=UPI001E5D904C|nr:P-loop NTPase fold protein [Candidatus Absconditicoccus praedator]UFX83353.1 hypothetical protein HLG78_04460 [Candidatus Absconditicoccus praedator]
MVDESKKLYKINGEEIQGVDTKFGNAGELSSEKAKIRGVIKWIIDRAYEKGFSKDWIQEALDNYINYGSGKNKEKNENTYREIKVSIYNNLENNKNNLKKFFRGENNTKKLGIRSVIIDGEELLNSSILDKLNIVIFELSNSSRKNAKTLYNTRKNENNEVLNFFAWDDKFGKNTKEGDLVFFVNKSAKEENDEFSILVTRIYDRGYELKNKNNDQNQKFYYLEKDGNQKKLYYIGNEEDAPEGVDNSNNLSKWEWSENNQKTFVVFEVLYEIRNITDWSGYRNLGAAQFTYIKSLYDDRLQFIIETLRNNLSENLKDKNFLNVYINSLDVPLGDVDIYYEDSNDNKSINIWGRFFDKVNKDKTSTIIFDVINRYNIGFESDISYRKQLLLGLIISFNKDYEDFIKLLLADIYIRYLRGKSVGQKYPGNFNFNGGCININGFKELLTLNIKEKLGENDLSLHDNENENYYTIEKNEENKEIVQIFESDDITEGFKSFLDSISIKFDYIYLAKSYQQIKNIVEKYKTGENKEEDQKSFSVGIIGKWGEGKTKLVSLLKEYYLENENYSVYEVDVWKGYSINGVETEKKGFIKYIYRKLIEKELGYEEYKYGKSITDKIKNSYIGILITFLTKTIFFLFFFIIESFLKTFYNKTYFGNYYTSSSLKQLNLKYYYDKLYNNIFLYQRFSYAKFFFIFYVFGLIFFIFTYNLECLIYFECLEKESLEQAEYIPEYIKENEYIITFLLLIPFFILFLYKYGFKTNIYDKQIQDSNLADKFGNELFNIIGDNNKKIIILENIDRLNPDQIIDVIDLTKTVLDFPDTVYIIPIDPNLVKCGLENKYKDFNGQSKEAFNPDLYLDKIIQFPYYLVNPYLLNIKKITKKEIEKFNLKLYGFLSTISQDNDDFKRFESYFDHLDFKRRVLCNYNPRKEQIFNQIKKVYSEIYNNAIDYYNVKNNNNEFYQRLFYNEFYQRLFYNEFYQRLFLVFFAIRFADISLFMKIEKKPYILLKLFGYISSDIEKINNDNNLEKNLFTLEVSNISIEILEQHNLECINSKNYIIENNLLEKEEIVLLLEILGNFYPLSDKNYNNYDYLKELTVDHLQKYMRRAYVPLRKDN